MILGDEEEDAGIGLALGVAKVLNQDPSDMVKPGKGAIGEAIARHEKLDQLSWY
jgi:hypothetical protein